MKRWLAILLLLSSFMLVGCIKEKENLVVNLEFNTFPEKYTCDGDNISPMILIEGLKSEVKSLVIIMDDEDAPGKVFTHWLIWNIQPTNVIPEDIPKKEKVNNPVEGVQGLNDFGEIGYSGPCPPPGKLHHYHFRVYALDTFLELKGGVNRKSLEDAMEGHILQYGEAVATYGRAFR